MNENYFKLRYRYPSGKAYSTTSGSDLWVVFDVTSVEFYTSDDHYYPYSWSRLTMSEDKNGHFVFDTDDAKRFIL